MPVSVKKTLTLNNLPKNISRNFSRSLKNEIGNVIKDRILGGQSPVKYKRFKQYNAQYARRKGVPRKPVNMKATGKMLRSLRVKQNRIGQVLIEFEKSIVATYHNNSGAGRSRIIRRLLPDRSGEEFSPSVQRKINRILQKAVRKSTRR